MVIINGMVAARVPKPTRIKKEQNTSANTASESDNPALKPNNGGNLISPEKSMVNFGMPCTSINAAITTLVIRITKSIFLLE